MEKVCEESDIFDSVTHCLRWEKRFEIVKCQFLCGQTLGSVLFQFRANDLRANKKFMVKVLLRF